MLKRNRKKVLNMTICVAGICKYTQENNPDKVKEGIIFATDHMVTIEGLGQFEHKIRKYAMLENGMIIMVAGSIPMSEIIKGNSFEKKGFIETCEIIRLRLKRLRDKMVEDEILNRLGFTFTEMKELSKKEIQNEVIGKMIVECAEADLEAEEVEGGLSEITSQDRANQIMTTIQDLIAQIYTLLKEYAYWKNN